MKLNRKELINAIQTKVEGSTKAEIDSFIEAFTEVVTETLVDGGVVNILGFGRFETREKMAKEGVHPRTLEKITIPSMTVPKFVAGTLLKRAVKGE